MYSKEYRIPFLFCVVPHVLQTAMMMMMMMMMMMVVMVMVVVVVVVVNSCRRADIVCRQFYGCSLLALQGCLPNGE
jgi:hypothetical protein